MPMTLDELNKAHLKLARDLEIGDISQSKYESEMANLNKKFAENNQGQAEAQAPADDFFAKYKTHATRNGRIFREVLHKMGVTPDAVAEPDPTIPEVSVYTSILDQYIKAKDSSLIGDEKDAYALAEKIAEMVNVKMGKNDKPASAEKGAEKTAAEPATKATIDKDKDPAYNPALEPVKVSDVDPTVPEDSAEGRMPLHVKLQEENAALKQQLEGNGASKQPETQQTAIPPAPGDGSVMGMNASSGHAPEMSNDELIEKYGVDGLTALAAGIHPGDKIMEMTHVMMDANNPQGKAQHDVLRYTDVKDAETYDKGSKNPLHTNYTPIDAITPQEEAAAA